MFKLFMQGGAGFMTILTILLVAIFFAAWKAPAWVKEIGSFALVFGFLTYLIGLYPADVRALQGIGDLDSEEPEAQVHHLPESQVSLIGHSNWLLICVLVQDKYKIFFRQFPMGINRPPVFGGRAARFWGRMDGAVCVVRGFSLFSHRL